MIRHFNINSNTLDNQILFRRKFKVEVVPVIIVNKVCIETPHPISINIATKVVLMKSHHVNTTIAWIFMWRFPHVATCIIIKTSQVFLNSKLSLMRQHINITNTRICMCWYQHVATCAVIKIFKVKLASKIFLRKQCITTT